MATPYALHHLSVTESTQDEARSLFEGSAVLVVADAQTAGRGRHGRSWVTAPRALAASLAFLPSVPPSAWGPLPLAAGLAAREAIASTWSVEVGIKWPNDLVTASGKVAGILVEVAGGLPVAGLGLNVWWEHPPEGYAGLLETDPGLEAPHAVAARWAEQLLDRAGRLSDDWGREEYERHCLTLGHDVRWRPHGEGRAVAVAEDGSLVVRTETGVEQLRAGEVWELRSSE